MKIDAKKFLALTQLMAMPLVSATAGCIINTDDEGTSTGNDSVGDGTTDGSATAATSSATGASASGGSGDGSTGADASAGTGGTGGTAADDTGGTAAEASATGAETGTVDPEGCCVAHETPGCTDTAVNDCVCADPRYQVACCDAVEGFWDQFCIDAVASLQCGKCP